MKSGSAFFVLSFPSTWPVISTLTMVNEEIENERLIIISNTNGSITVSVQGNEFTTQKIQFQNAHRALISCLWNEEEKEQLSVFINSKKIVSYNSETFLVNSKPELSKPIVELTEKEIKKTCQPWLDWRKHRYSDVKTVAKEGRILKTIDRQLQELQDSLDSLISHQQTFSSRDNLYLMNVLPILRSLLFWPDSKGMGSKYNPLFLRIVGFLKFPLPIYAFKDRIKEIKDNPLYTDAIVSRIHNHPSLIKKYDNEELMDFQEWLDMEIIIENKVGIRKTYRWKDVIFDGANASSSAHFDDDLPFFIEKLKTSITWNRTVFFDYIHSIVSITIELGEKILKAANTK